MQYQPNFSIRFWKQLLINSKNIGSHFHIDGDVMIFESAGHGQIDLSKVLPVLVELAETNPVGIKLEEVRIKKRFINDYKIKIDRYNARQQTAASVSPSGSPKLKEADPYCPDLCKLILQPKNTQVP